mmetsp:Transcript_14132/g.30434  ORF Transcript_14132/g.30434 Transcript_14132/m.30434 type:complete len:311 (+) Transcript_14132:328-1260(+)
MPPQHRGSNHLLAPNLHGMRIFVILNHWPSFAALRKVLHLGDLPNHVLRELNVPFACLAVCVSQHERGAGVGRFAHLRLERHFGGERDSKFVLEPRGVASTEQKVPVAGVWRDEVAHVFNNADGRYVDLVEHRDALHDVHERQLLRRGDDHGGVNVECLAQRELHVAGSRRHVQHEVVQLAPIRRRKQLRQYICNHRPAHDGGLVVYIPERHQFHAADFHRHHAPVPKLHHGLVRLGHRWKRRSVDIRIHDSDFGAERRQRIREVHGSGALPNAAFAARDGNYRADHAECAFQIGAAWNRGLRRHVDLGG